MNSKRCRIISSGSTRTSVSGFLINDTTSAGLGGSRLLATRDHGWFALSLIRDADRELMPALFGDAEIKGRELGLPVASTDEAPASPPIELLVEGQHRGPPALQDRARPGLKGVTPSLIAARVSELVRRQEIVPGETSRADEVVTMLTTRDALPAQR